MRQRGPIALLASPLDAGKLPPQAPELEQAVLGAVMLEASAIAEIGDFMRPEAFYVHAHQMIWEAVETLYRRRDPIDILTVTATLRANGELDVVGGAFYITQLTSKVASASNVQYHARIVLQLFIRREQIRIGNEIMSRAYAEDCDTFDSLAEASMDLRRLGDLGTPDARPMSEIIPEAMDQGGADRGVRFGFHTIDDKIRLEPGTVTIIGARPAMGKTAFMLSSAWRQAQTGRRPYIVELEMKDRNLGRRLVCGETGVPIWKVKRKLASEADLDLMASWHVTYGDAQARMIVDEAATMTVSSLAARLDRAKRKMGIDMVWIDYLGLLQPSERKKSAYDRMTAISNELRVLAKEIDLPFAVLAQLSRPPKGDAVKPPRLIDLRDSGEIEQDAEAVCFLHRPKYYDQGAGDEVNFIIAKYRDGEDGMRDLHFDPEGIRMLDPSETMGGIPRYRPAAPAFNPALPPTVKADPDAFITPLKDEAAPF